MNHTPHRTLSNTAHNMADTPPLPLAIHADADELAAAVAKRIAESARQAIVASGMFRIALAGGETPRRCYAQLCNIALDWQRIQVYFGDERCLPEGDAKRNDSMALATLLSQVPIPQQNIHRIAAELGAEEAALHYDELLAATPPLDLVLLGLGEDGHIASLFPNHPALNSIHFAVAVHGAPKLPADRVSLGLKAINAAQRRLFMVSGAAKHQALMNIMQDMQLPAARVALAEWHVDRAAISDKTT